MGQILRDTSPHPLDEEPVYFSPGSYFLGIAKRLAASNGNARVILPGRGEVNIIPSQRKYFANVPDMAEFCQAPAAAFEVSALKKEEGELLQEMGHEKNINELFWQAAFHASQGRLIESSSNGESVHIYDVIRFHHWPNLTRLPTTQNTMRICALLTRHPSTIMLVHRKLGIAPREVFQVYSAACSSGLVNVISNHLGQTDIQADIEDGQAAQTHRHGLLHSLLAKISGL